MIQQQQAYFLELYRAGMRTASDIARASIETTQRIHSQQADAMREALEENQRSARELGEVRSLDQLMALQTRLAGEQMQRSAETWSRLWRTASESQTAMIEKVQSYGAANFGAAGSAANTAASTAGKERKSA